MAGTDFNKNNVYGEQALDKDQCLRILEYPYTGSPGMTNQEGCSITFKTYRIIPPDVRGVNFNMDTIKTVFGGLASGDRTAVSQSLSNAADGARFQTYQEKWTGEGIRLYLPTSFLVNDTFVYNRPELGAMGVGTLNAIKNASTIGKVASDALEAGIGSLGRLFTGATGDVARLGLLRAAQKFAPNEVGNAASIAGAVAVNPNTRAMFSNVAPRTFTFQFKFIARSSSEAEEVKDIIKRFRVAAYPEAFEVVAGVTAGYKYPDLFDIELRYEHKNGSVPIGTKIKRCFLESVSTNYNPTLMAFHADGNPIEIDLTLSFVENKTLDRNDIEKGGY